MADEPAPAASGSSGGGFAARAKAKALKAKDSMVTGAKAGMAAGQELGSKTGLVKSAQEKQLEADKAAAVAAMQAAGVEVDTTVGPDGKPLPEPEQVSAKDKLSGLASKAKDSMVTGAKAGMAAGQELGSKTGLVKSAQEKQLEADKAAAVAAMQAAGVEVDTTVGPDGKPLPEPEPASAADKLSGLASKAKEAGKAAASAGMAGAQKAASVVQGMVEEGAPEGSYACSFDGQSAILTVDEGRVQVASKDGAGVIQEWKLGELESFRAEEGSLVLVPRSPDAGAAVIKTKKAQDIADAMQRQNAALAAQTIMQQ
jgi:hypothetical protein